MIRVFVLLACLVSLLSACGQSGDLYLPEKPKPVQETNQETNKVQA